jgi:hypothetical protein
LLKVNREADLFNLSGSNFWLGVFEDRIEPFIGVIDFMIAREVVVDALVAV